MATTITDVACTVCGCVCDDLKITVDHGRIVRAEGACSLAEPWFLSQNTTHPSVASLEGGVDVTLSQAYDRAAELLRAARNPLLFGLSRSTTEGQRAAVELADRIGATIDTTASTGHAPSIMALQQVGESTSTLGEVRNRADLIVFWGSDPVRTHPRHLERYSADPVGRWVSGGRSDRFVVVVDHTETESARLADLFIQVPPDRNWEVLWALRLLVNGLQPANPESLGVELSQLAELSARMKACQCGSVFFGSGITRERLAHRTIEALLQLVTDLNQYTRFYARRMRRFGDVAGADSVLVWQTGYPFGVNLSRPYPRYNPGEYTGPEMLARGEVDLCILIGSETIADFAPRSIEQLRRIPVILLDAPGTQTSIEPAVRFTTAVYGVHRTGTAYRMDEVPIPLRVLLPTGYPSDGEVLRELVSRVS